MCSGGGPAPMQLAGNRRRYGIAARTPTSRGACIFRFPRMARRMTLFWSTTCIFWITSAAAVDGWIVPARGDRSLLANAVGVNRLFSVMSRRHFVVGLATAALSAPRAVRAQGLTPLVLAGVPDDSITPVLYGIQSGIFKSYGLDVRLEPERSGPAITSAIIGGTYQFGKASISPLVLAHAKGLPFTIVAAGGIYNASAPIDGMFVRADSPYKTGADLNGKTFGVYGIGDIFTISTKAWMLKTGGDPATIKLLELPISAMVPAIEAGRIDAGSMNEPALQIALSSPKLRLIAHAWDAIAPRFLYTAWFASTSYAAANPAVVSSFEKAMRDAAAFVNAHESETVDLIARFTSVDPAVIRKMTRVEQGVGLNPALIAPVIDAMARLQYISSAFDARALLYKA
jgi:NitT/TauT family transport system substrate-binding protein